MFRFHFCHFIAYFHIYSIDNIEVIFFLYAFTLSFEQEHLPQVLVTVIMSFFSSLLNICVTSDGQFSLFPFIISSVSDHLCSQLLLLK